MKKIIITLCVSLVMIFGSDLYAQNNTKENIFSVKIDGNIGVGNVLGLATSLPGLEHNSSFNSIGVDLSYSFWQNSNMSLSVNAGLAYEKINANISLGQLNYNYDAGSGADMDGNTYRRYYDIKNVKQNFSGGYISIPVYLTYTFHFSKRFNVYANIGIRPGFKASAKNKSFNANVYSYGIFPQYDNLMIDEEWLNDFGHKELTNRNLNKIELKGVNMIVMAGVGVETRIYGPMYMSIGFNYNAGLTNIFKEDKTATPIISYTVKEGQQCKSLTQLFDKSKLSNIGINIALTYRF